MTEHTPTDPSGSLDGSPVIVHKDGEEGGLVIGSLSGRILTPIMERPEWSEGLAVAKLAERAQFYESRLGKNVTGDSLINFADLGWVCVDATGEEMETEADPEFRMNALAEAIGIDRVDDISAESHDDLTGQQAYVVTDESHDYAKVSGPKAIEWTEALAEAAEDSKRKTGTAD